MKGAKVRCAVSEKAFGGELESVSRMWSLKRLLMDRL